MNKLFTKIATLSVGLFMAIGVGVAVGSKSAKAERADAAEEVYKHMVFNSTNNSKGVSSYSNTWTNTTDGFIWNLANWNNNNNGWSYIKAGNKNTAYVATIISSSVDKVVTKVDVDISAVTTANINSLKLYYGTDANPSTNETSITVGTGTKTVTIPSAKQAANMYYKLAVDCKAAANGSFTLTDFKLYADNTPSTTYTVSFDANGGGSSMSPVSDVSGSYTLPACGFTAPSGKAFAGWKAENAGDLIPAGDSYNVTADVKFYAQWANAYTVTYEAGPNGSGSYNHANQPAGNYSLLPFSSLSGISASSGYRIKNYTVGGVDKNPNDTITLSAATTVTVNFELIPEETTYVFATNYSTYASSWTTTYGTKTVNGKTDVGGDYDATIKFTRVNKQSSDVGSNEPYMCPNTASDEESLVFTLNETGKKIKDVTVTFRQRGSNAPTFKLFKGNSVAVGSALDTATIGTKNTLSTTNINDTSFSISGNANKSGNAGAALVSIYISVEAQSAYGKTDHITVTSFPNTVYHIGENYDPTGLAVTAYDGPDEGTANFKDVTADVTTRFGSLYVFDDDDVPTTNMWVEYEDEDHSHYYADDIVMHVYALAEYELVTSEPSDWSGNYLIVAANGDGDLCAMNGALYPLDIEGNHKGATEKSTGVIENGQELEFVISAVSGGYSIQGKNGKYIGWSSGSSNGLTASDTPLVNTFSISGSDVTIAGSGGRKLTFNNDGAGRFRYYTSGTVQLYKLKTSSKADEYAQTFLGAITCDASGEEEPSFTIKEGSTYWSWALLSEEYDTLTPAEKEQFRLGVASQTGDNIAQALAKYDYIVGKYNKGLGMTEKYPDFMLRNPDPINKSSVMPFGSETEANNTAIIVIVSISAISVLSIAVLLTLKKRKLR